ncbi:MAG: hypothetical protein QNJ47_22925 [Nostocaceae cyanobacterium]|nr:hypothetical protein [Nostocaceae cyanobacterium]
MLKSLLLSGWFRVQPFFKYVVLMTVIAPLLATFGYSSSAKQSLVKTKTPIRGESDSVSGEISTAEDNVASAIAVTKITPPQTEDSQETSGEIATTPSPEVNFAFPVQGVFDAVPMEIAAVREPQMIQPDAIESLVGEGDSASENISVDDPLAAVELAPEPVKSVPVTKKMPASKSNLKLAQRLRAYKAASSPKKDVLVSQAASSDKTLSAAKISPVRKTTKATTQEVNVVKEIDFNQGTELEDPLGSPHPIPWKWIMATQKSVSSAGASGTRYYRSVPVVSPDGRYAVYSRVQLEIEPHMHNSRVNSVLFIEDTQTKTLRVLKSTNSRVKDPLLPVATSSTEVAKQSEGTIEIFVPVSWSENGDRFLARKFQGVMNTSDITDHALIWDRQQNRTNSVTPEKTQEEHNKMAILLGWSQNQPNGVIFRAGELGDEDWSLVTVATTNGKTLAMNDVDKPVTFGEKVTEVWVQPQVAISY